MKLQHSREGDTGRIDKAVVEGSDQRTAEKEQGGSTERQEKRVTVNKLCTRLLSCATGSDATVMGSSAVSACSSTSRFNISSA
jgi:hypothetical protein